VRRYRSEFTNHATPSGGLRRVVRTIRWARGAGNLGGSALPLRRASVPYARLRRYSGGVSPVSVRKGGGKELVSLKPTPSPISVTDSLRSASKALARSIRRLVRYRCGGMPNESLNAREKWNGLSCTSRARDDSEISSARCSSIYCVNFFCCQPG